MHASTPDWFGTAFGEHEPRIVLDGEERAILDAGAVEALRWRERSASITCATGEEYDATWGGVALPDALERAGIADETTHVVVTAADGYRVCLDVPSAFDALIAFARDGRPIAERAAHGSRLVASGIEGARTVKSVDRVETVALAPDENPEAREDLQLGN